MNTNLYNIFSHFNDPNPHLNPDCTWRILSYFKTSDLINISQTDKNFYNILNNDRFKTLFLSRFDMIRNENTRLFSTLQTFYPKICWKVACWLSEKPNRYITNPAFFVDLPESLAEVFSKDQYENYRNSPRDLSRVSKNLLMEEIAPLLTIFSLVQDIKLKEKLSNELNKKCKEIFTLTEDDNEFITKINSESWSILENLVADSPHLKKCFQKIYFPLEGIVLFQKNKKSNDEVRCYFDSKSDDDTICAHLKYNVSTWLESIIKSLYFTITKNYRLFDLIDRDDSLKNREDYRVLSSRFPTLGDVMEGLYKNHLNHINFFVDLNHQIAFETHFFHTSELLKVFNIRTLKETSEKIVQFYENGKEGDFNELFESIKALPYYELILNRAQWEAEHPLSVYIIPGTKMSYADYRLMISGQNIEVTRRNENPSEFHRIDEFKLTNFPKSEEDKKRWVTSMITTLEILMQKITESQSVKSESSKFYKKLIPLKQYQAIDTLFSNLLGGYPSDNDNNNKHEYITLKFTHRWGIINEKELARIRSQQEKLREEIIDKLFEKYSINKKTKKFLKPPQIETLFEKILERLPINQKGH